MSRTSPRAPRNRTVTLSNEEVLQYKRDLETSVLHGDARELLPTLEPKSFDLLFADPPYNLNKTFGNKRFAKGTSQAYASFLESWLRLCVPLLKDTASIYVCGDWRSGSAIEQELSKHFKLRNRITWEREKGRGAKGNWKNASEDIWFFTVSDRYTFNLDAVKQRRRVLAPYRTDGEPKDWTDSGSGKFRDTHPSNLWTDITVPFWSMPENTDHPTQKPEKLLAKLILASTDPGDLILDPFAGSGTTAVVAKKLGRRFIVIESEEDYCLLAAKRLRLAETDPSIQGFSDGVFWERNSVPRPVK